MSATINERTEKYLRQLDLANPLKFKHPVSILGVGAIGSAAAIAVAKLGCPKGITLVDFDRFERHNVSNQLCFEEKHLGLSKAVAVGDLCRDMGHGDKLNPVDGKLVGAQVELTQGGTKPARSLFRGIVLNTPDSMLARKELWEQTCMFNPEVNTVIDARMAGQYLQVLTTQTMTGFDHYTANLITDEEATPEPCGARAIIYTSLMAGGLIAGLVKKAQLGEVLPREIRFDLATLELTQTLHNGEVVTNRDALALASVK
jgi:hypothetical protein